MQANVLLGSYLHFDSLVLRDSEIKVQPDLSSHRHLSF